MRKNAHDTNYEVRIEVPPGLEWRKNLKRLCFSIEMVRFVDLETGFTRCKRWMKLAILANMTLNVILTLIALITVIKQGKRCLEFDASAA